MKKKHKKVLLMVVDKERDRERGKTYRKVPSGVLCLLGVCMCICVYNCIAAETNSVFFLISRGMCSKKKKLIP